MTNPQLSDPHWIDGQGALDALVELLSSQPSFGADIEANSFFAYREQVCLIQISAAGEDYLVDPFAGLDLTGLGEIFANPDIIKIFHDGEYDIGLMKKDFGFDFAGIFDTRVAVANLGSKTPGLASVLKERFGVTLDKKYQRSNWGKRPLTPDQINYARLDTHFLVELYGQLQGELDQAGRTEMVESEFRRLANLPPKEQTFDPNGFIKIKGSRDLEPVQLSILKQLYLKREELAKRANQPVFRILGNDTLMDLARLAPRDEKGMTQARGFTWKLAKKMGRQILAAIRTGQDKGPLTKIPTIKKPGAKKLSPRETDLYEKLRLWRKDRAEEEGIDSAHLLRRDLLIELAKKRPRTLADLKKIHGVEDWHIKGYGDDILAVINGKK